MKKAASLLCLAVLFLMLGGCQMIRIEEENKTPLAYTVIEDSQIPEEMQELIREKKETEFQIAYQKGTELFLAKGYGRQMSGGYSIQVKELSASSNAVFFETKSSSLCVLKYGKLRSIKDGGLNAIYAIKKYASTTTLVSE